MARLASSSTDRMPWRSVPVGEMADVWGQAGRSGGLAVPFVRAQRSRWGWSSREHKPRATRLANTSAEEWVDAPGQTALLQVAL